MCSIWNQAGWVQESLWYLYFLCKKCEAFIWGHGLARFPKFLFLHLYGWDPRKWRNSASTWYIFHLSMIALVNSPFFWNNHKNTHCRKSPLQLFILGLQKIRGERGTVPSEYFKNLTQASLSFCTIISKIPKKQFWVSLSSRTSSHTQLKSNKFFGDLCFAGYFHCSCWAHCPPPPPLY